MKKIKNNKRASRKDNMTRDHSEYIDDYCRDLYGHSNWGYLDTYSKEELKAKDHDIENNIVFWHEDDEEEEGEEWKNTNYQKIIFV